MAEAPLLIRPAHHHTSCFLRRRECGKRHRICHQAVTGDDASRASSAPLKANVHRQATRRIPVAASRQPPSTSRGERRSPPAHARKHPAFPPRPHPGPAIPPRWPVHRRALAPPSRNRRLASIAEFWGRRWNSAFRDLAHPFVFVPAARRWGLVVALWVSFAVSGFAHELVISVPAGAGFGLPTAYFL